jgi:hypothetical protein
MKFIGTCAEGGCLQSKPIVEIRGLGGCFLPDIVNLLIVIWIGEVDLGGGDPDNWTCSYINDRARLISPSNFQLPYC